MGKKGSLEETFEKYKQQIQVFFQWSGGNFLKTAEIVSWVYGVGTPEGWRKFLSRKLTISTPKISSTIEQFLSDITKRRGERK